MPVHLSAAMRDSTGTRQPQSCHPRSGPAAARPPLLIGLRRCLQRPHATSPECGPCGGRARGAAWTPRSQVSPPRRRLWHRLVAPDPPPRLSSQRRRACSTSVSSLCRGQLIMRARVEVTELSSVEHVGDELAQEHLRGDAHLAAKLASDSSRAGNVGIVHPGRIRSPLTEPAAYRSRTTSQG